MAPSQEAGDHQEYYTSRIGDSDEKTFICHDGILCMIKPWKLVEIRSKKMRWNNYTSEVFSSEFTPEKWWLEDYFSIGEATFQGRTVKLPGGNPTFSVMVTTMVQPPSTENLLFLRILAKWNNISPT